MGIEFKLKMAVINTYIRMLRLINGVDGEKVVFTSFNYSAYSDNPKAISEAVHKIAPNKKIVWIFDDPKSKEDILPSYVQTVSTQNKNEYYKTLATAGAYVSNFSLPNIAKGRKQFFVQTWHGDRAFKKVLYDSSFKSNTLFIPESRKGYCDLAVAGSKYGEMQYRSAFRYEGEVLMAGTPRDDKLVNPDDNDVTRIKEVLGIKKDTKILLYAPTLRRGKKEDQEVKDLDLEIIRRMLEEKYNCDWCVLVRAHPTVKALSGIQFSEKIEDASGYEDMADLLLVSDMLITDYSSCAGDFALRGCPLILFQPDRQEYIEKDRTFYFDVFESPYWVADKGEELEKIVAEMNDESVGQMCKDVLEFYGTCEGGNSAEIVAQRICDRIGK